MSSENKEPKDTVLECHQQTFQVARQLEALGFLLEKAFEADEDVAMYGLGTMLMGFADELTAVYRSLDAAAVSIAAREAPPQ